MHPDGRSVRSNSYQSQNIFELFFEIQDEAFKKTDALTDRVS